MSYMTERITILENNLNADYPVFLLLEQVKSP